MGGIDCFLIYDNDDDDGDDDDVDDDDDDDDENVRRPCVSAPAGNPNGPRHFHVSRKGWRIFIIIINVIVIMIIIVFIFTTVIINLKKNSTSLEEVDTIKPQILSKISQREMSKI